MCIEKCLTIEGKEIFIDTSGEACQRFNVKPGQRISETFRAIQKRRQGSIAGVEEVKRKDQQPTYRLQIRLDGYDGKVVCYFGRTLEEMGIEIIDS